MNVFHCLISLFNIHAQLFFLCCIVRTLTITPAESDESDYFGKSTRKTIPRQARYYQLYWGFQLSYQLICRAT